MQDTYPCQFSLLVGPTLNKRSFIFLFSQLRMLWVHFCHLRTILFIVKESANSVTNGRETHLGMSENEKGVFHGCKKYKGVIVNAKQ